MSDKTIEELEAALAAALAAKRAGDTARRESQSAAWRALTSNPDSWEWSITPQRRQGFMSDPQTDGLRVEARIKPALLEAWREGGPASTSSNVQEGRWMGMYYWRTDEGILTHSGGGTMVLRDPVLCSDEQWAGLAAGIVPLKWQRVIGWS